MIGSSRFMFGVFGFLSIFTLFSLSAAAQSHQDSSTTSTFQKEVVIAAPPEAPAVKPVLMVPAGTVVPLEARVVPPAPRIVVQREGQIVVPGDLGTGDDYRASEAGVSTSLQVNSSFGYRGGRRHNGIDFQASWGESVGASSAGTVVFAAMKRGYGNLIILDHGRGVTTYYAHLSSMYIGIGQTVSAGQVIGAIGTTGRSSGPHLHYEVRVNGDPVNPNSIVLVPADGFPVQAPAESLEPISQLDAPAERIRPRRVVKANPTSIVIAGSNSLTQY